MEVGRTVVTNNTVSSVLIQEDGKAEKPIYYVSRVQHGAEARYQRLEKLALALLISERNLRPYFQSHTIVVNTDQPIRQIMQKPDLAGRMVGWAVELSEFASSMCQEVQLRHKP